MKKVLRTLSILLSIVIIVSLFTGCSDSGSKKASLVKTKPYKELKQGNEIPSEGVITENDRFSMSWNSFYSQVVITDKKNGAVYSTVFSWTTYRKRDLPHRCFSDPFFPVCA